MRRTLIFVLIFIGLLAVPILARYLRYYNLTGSDREQPPVYEPADVPAMVPTPQAADYRDDPDQTEGSILLDMAHNNAFTLDELSELDRGLSARGMERVLKVSRTIADLEGKGAIGEEHVGEALQFRGLDRSPP